MKPELILDCLCKLGENPLWHPFEMRLYWTDILDQKIYAYDPLTGSLERFDIGRPVGGFTIQVDGALLCFMDKGAVAVWREGRLETVIDEIPAERDFRFNDVIADPAGRVFCGTMAMKSSSGLGRLYRLDPDGSFTVVLEGIGTSNGLGFTGDRQHLYYTDSRKRSIYLFDYDQKTGSISNQRLWLQTPEGAGVPDGMTVDDQDHVWSARWNGSALYRYTPAGKEERRIEFPARKVTSLTFGGDDLSDIYVTTALSENTRQEEGQGAGAIFRLRLGIRGRPEYFSRIMI